MNILSALIPSSLFAKSFFEGTFLFVVMSLVKLTAGLLGISVLVTIHELGHYLFCLLFGVKAPSFSIGIGPRLWEKKIGDTVFAISALPLGGYVEIAGTQEVGQGEQEYARLQGPGSFGFARYPQKMCILLGGIFFNLLSCLLTLICIFSLSGIPQSSLTLPLSTGVCIQEISPNSPAAAAELSPKDHILSINGQSLAERGGASFLSNTLKEHAGTTITLIIKRNNEELHKTVSLLSDPSQSVLGVKLTPTHNTAPLSWKSSIQKSLFLMGSWISGTYHAFRHMISHKTLKGLQGPVSVIHILGQSSSSGFISLLLYLCALSVGLACMNLIPLPVFDGGQIVMYTIEAFLGRSFDSFKLVLHYITWALLMLLFVWISWHDIIRLIWG